MIELFAERHYESPLAPADVFAMGAAGAGCFGIYRIQWLESLLALGGHTLVCHFLAPDAEALRAAFRMADGRVPTLWAGAVFGDREGTVANVAVERQFDAPVRFDDLQAREQQRGWCLEAHGVEPERSILSLDGRRMLCLYRAPDAEAVRAAQQQAGMPVQRVWAFRRLTPADMSSG
jgi:hypothetical protein